MSRLKRRRKLQQFWKLQTFGIFGRSSLVIPFSLVRDKIEPVPVSQRAHPLSAEFIVKKLPRNCFDAIGVDGI